MYPVLKYDRLFRTRKCHSYKLLEVIFLEFGSSHKTVFELICGFKRLYIETNYAWIMLIRPT